MPVAGTFFQWILTILEELGAIPVMGANSGPLQWIRLVSKILASALKAELVTLVMELYKTGTHYADGSGPS